MGGARIVVAALVLAGCARVPPQAVAAAPEPVPALMPVGEAAPPPAGWLDYCRRHAADPGCGNPA